MITTAGEIIDQGAQRLRINKGGTWHLQDRNIIVNRDVSTILSNTQAGSVIRAAGIVFPVTAVRI